MTTAATSMHGYIRHMQRYLHCQPWTATQVVGEQTSRGGREVEEKGDTERDYGDNDKNMMYVKPIHA